MTNFNLFFYTDDDGQIKRVSARFEHMPRIGEVIEIKDLTSKQSIFEVVSIIHVASGGQSNVVNIYLKPLDENDEKVEWFFKDI